MKLLSIVALCTQAWLLQAQDLSPYFSFDTVIINPSIQSLVEEQTKIFDGHLGMVQTTLFINDTLIEYTEPNEGMSFAKIFTYVKNDTLKSSGLIDLNEFLLFYTIIAPEEKYLLKAQLISKENDFVITPKQLEKESLEVSFLSSSLNLAKEPDFKVGSTMHGMITFTTDNFFILIKDVETKLRFGVEVYFISEVIK